MASNTQLNANSTSGDILVTKQISHDGDTAKIQGVYLAGISGTEDSYTAVDVQAGNGTSTNALRVTISSDSTGLLSVDDNSGSLTVDAPVGTPVFVRLSDGTDPITTLPVSLASVPSHAVTNAGTFAVQAAQSGTWTVDLGATDNAVLDSILSALQGTLTVGSHAVTNAGTFAVQVDGSALTSLQLLDDAVYVDDADWTDSTSKHLLVGGLYQSTPQTVTDGDVAPFNITSTGALHVAVQNTPTVTANLSATDNAVLDSIQAAVEGTLTVDGSGVTQPVSHAALTELAAAINASSQVDINIAASGATVPISHAALTELASAIDTELQVDIVGALPAGTNAIGKLAANSGVDIGDVDVTSISAGSNLIGDVGLQPRTSGGLSIFRSIDLDESEEEIKDSAGQVYGIIVINLASSVRYLKLYNATAANVTVGTTTPVITIPVPTAGSANGAGFVLMLPQGIAFSTAITAAATTGVADNDTGAPGANEIVLNVLYK